MINNLKYNFTNRLKYWIRRFNYLERLRKMEKFKKQKVLLFQTPLHKNLGDHLIAVAGIQFLKGIGIDSIFEIPNEMLLQNKNKLLEIVNDNDIIIITGGGFIGNVWASEEKIMEMILEAFPSNRVIIFPQTIYFNKERPDYESEFRACQRALENHRHLTLFVRERNSYGLIKNSFSNINVMLAPDIALSYFYEPLVLPRREVGFCLRNDIEKVSNEKIITFIRKVIDDYKLNIKYTDTMSKSRVWEHDREKFVLDKIKEFSKYKLLVTDRLHGMIFAYLAGTPCVFIDNSTKKVSGVYDAWLKDYKRIMPAVVEDEEKLGEFICKAIEGEILATNGPLELKYFEGLKGVCTYEGK